MGNQSEHPFYTGVDMMVNDVKILNRGQQDFDEHCNGTSAII